MPFQMPKHRNVKGYRQSVQWEVAFSLASDSISESHLSFLPVQVNVSKGNLHVETPFRRLDSRAGHCWTLISDWSELPHNNTADFAKLGLHTVYQYKFLIIDCRMLGNLSPWFNPRPSLKELESFAPATALATGHKSSNSTITHRRNDQTTCMQICLHLAYMGKLGPVIRSSAGKVDSN